MPDRLGSGCSISLGMVSDLSLAGVRVLRQLGFESCPVQWGSRTRSALWVA